MLLSSCVMSKKINYLQEGDNLPMYNDSVSFDDYKLQAGVLNNLKQKQYWEENAPDEMYKSDYKWALLNNGVLNKDLIFVDFVCAFPHSKLDISRDSSQANISHKLWNKLNHDSNDSFADF